MTKLIEIPFGGLTQVGQSNHVGDTQQAAQLRGLFDPFKSIWSLLWCTQLKR